MMSIFKVMQCHVTREWMRMCSNGGMIVTGENRSTCADSCRSPTLSATYPTRNSLELNLRPRRWVAGDQFLSHSVAACSYTEVLRDDIIIITTTITLVPSSRNKPKCKDLTVMFYGSLKSVPAISRAAVHLYEGWNFNSGNYLFTTDTKYE